MRRDLLLQVTWSAVFAVACGGDEETYPAACPTSDARAVPSCSELVGASFACEPAAHMTAPSDEQDWAAVDLDWQTEPPTSGAHFPFWQSCWGEQTWVLPRALYLHNLEHGGVVLSYNCPEGCPAELDTLRGVLAARADLPILLTQDPFLKGERFAATSWSWLYRTDAPDLMTLLCFVDQHIDRAPEPIISREATNQVCDSFMPPGS